MPGFEKIDGLSFREAKLVAIYCANGFNASAAAKEINTSFTDGSARVWACKVLTKPEVRAAIRKLINDEL
jgi:phage terminase small subunit